MTATADGNWVVVRTGPDYRVYNTVTAAYHRGTNNTVRVYRDAGAAHRRADILNGGSSTPANGAQQCPR